MMSSQDPSLQQASTVQPTSTGVQPPTANLTPGLLVLAVPIVLVLGIVIRRHHRTAQRQRWIAHLEKSWKLIPQNPHR